MTPNDLRNFLNKYALSREDFADLLGVTASAVSHWLDGRRSMSLTLTRLCKLFDKRPELMGEFRK